MTRYRIVTINTFIADRYLQFETVEYRRKFFFFGKTKAVRRWRFVPEDDYAVVLGFCLYQNECPTGLGVLEENDGYMLGCSYGQDSTLIGFARRYPDIEKYFEHLRFERQQHIEEKLASRQENTTYL